MQKYHAVSNRCAVRLGLLNLPVTTDEALEILLQKGFKLLSIDLISLARKCLTTSKYQRGVSPQDAPNVVDCSSFTKWLYGQNGIWLPRRSIQQSDLGEKVEIENIKAGDLIFVPGVQNYFHDDPDLGIGHVGIITNTETVVHASNSRVNVVETPISDFIGTKKFKVIKRYIPDDIKVHVFETPPSRSVEVEDDFKWIITQTLV